MMRRTTLLHGLVALLLLVTGMPPASTHARGGARAKKSVPAFPSHVVLVILGGGVRPSDMRDEELMPTLAAMAEEGRYVTKVESGAPDAYNAATRILTGRSESIDAAAKPRPAWPTLPEYLRAGRDLPATGTWFVSFEDGDRLHLAHSIHAQYGAVLAPSVTYGQGPFAQPLESFLDVLGRPLPQDPKAWQKVRRLRLVSRDAVSIWLPKSIDAGLPRAERVERALLKELDRKALLNRGPNPRDEQAIRAALTVLAVHRPILTVILLGEAEQGQASYASYRKVLAAGDQGLRRLRAAVAADPAMASTTTFVVTAGRARAAKPDADGRLAEAPATKKGREVGVILHGPGLARRPKLKGPRSLADLCPTIGHLLGVPTPHAEGQPWLGLLNPR